MSVYAVNERGPSAAPTTPVAQRTFWALFDVGVAALAILVSTDALNRFGVSSIVWLGVYALITARVILVWRGFFDLLARNVAYIVYPAVCGASTLWSYNGSDTLQAAVQLSFTIAFGMFIGWRFSLAAICILQFGATLLPIMVSLVNWLTGLFGTVYSPTGGLLGIFTQKNMLGQRGLFSAVSAVTILMMPRWRYSVLAKLAALGGLPFILLAVWLSASVTSILLLPAFTGLLFVLCLHKLPRSLIVSGLVVGVLVLALAPVVLAILGINPVAETLRAFGKDATLTGRTDMWDIAGQVLDTHAMFGVGYSAFWNASAFSNLSLLAQHIGGENVGSFHNFVLEILVGTGVLGLVAMAILIGVTLWRTFLLFFRTRSIPSAYALVLTVASVALSFVGTGLHRQHEYMIMFVVMVGVAAQRELRHAVSARR